MDWKKLTPLFEAIPLTQGKFAIVDKEDFPWLNKWKWYYKDGYAARNSKGNSRKIKRTTIRMHREIIKAEKGQDVDHINLDRLDNRKSNLRICNNFGNARNRCKYANNTSGYKGVYFEKESNKWKAQIVFKNKKINLGRYTNPREAAIVYDIAAEQLFKEFANTNFNRM